MKFQKQNGRFCPTEDYRTGVKLLHPKGMIAETIPDWLTECGSLVQKTKMFDDKTPNHVLVNEYKPGQGIMPHKDGPLYHPTVATISLGCHTCLDFYDDISVEGSYDLMDRYKFSLFLEPRSLLILKYSMYENLLHGIKEAFVDHVNSSFVKNTSLIGDPNVRKSLLQNESLQLQRMNTRVSLTIRHVPKTVKLKLRF
uniref:Fe2OG dioxygenase domain-containing protein n=1 Tax=Ciona savignyi TaxID=51511 RepID=H2YYH0_CIOSA